MCVRKRELSWRLFGLEDLARDNKVQQSPTNQVRTKTPQTTRRGDTRSCSRARNASKRVTAMPAFALALNSGTFGASFPSRAATRVRSRAPARGPRRVSMGSLKSSGGEDARSVPILFLDIDGVLNRTATAPQINLEQDKVDRLKGVLETSGADIVLTTYWRCFEDYIKYVPMRMGAPGDRVVEEHLGSRT